MRIGLEAPSMAVAVQERSRFEQQHSFTAEHWARYNPHAEVAAQSYQLGLIHRHRFLETLKMLVELTKEQEIKT